MVKLQHNFSSFVAVGSTKYIDFNNHVNYETEYTNINNNIDYFINTLKKFNNILLICGDYPHYGGSATNCNNIQDFLILNGFNTYAIYFNYQSSNLSLTQSYFSNSLASKK